MAPASRIGITLLAGLGLASHAYAQGTAPVTHSGRITDTSATTYELIETECSASVRIDGGRIIADEPLTLTGVGQWWRLTVAGTINDSGNDEIALTVSLQHIAGCDANHPLGTIYTAQYYINADNYSDGPHSLPNPGPFVPVVHSHGDHQDRFFNQQLSWTQATELLVFDEINSWQFRLQAEHTPTPGAMALLGVGGALVMGRRARRAP